MADWDAIDDLWTVDRCMTVYVVVLIQSITDREEYGRYGQGFMEVFSQYGGQLLAATESQTVIEGNTPYARTALMSFPSTDAANAWYLSPGYQALVQHRHRSSTGQIVLLPGLDTLDSTNVTTQEPA